MRWLTSGSRLTMLGAGALAALGQAPVNWGVPTLLGLMAGYWLFTRQGTGRQVFWTGWFFGTGYFAVALHWIVEPFLVDVAATGWMAPFALAGMAGGLALFWAAGFRLAFALRGGPLVWAVAMALAELLRAYLFTGFPWAMPAHAWINSPVAQLSAFIGAHGLNTLLFLSAALLVFGFSRIWAFRAGLAALVILSLIPLPAATIPDGGAKVRLIQPNVPQDEKWDRDKIEGFFNRQIDLTSEPGEPDVVIWPETAIPYAIPYADPLFEQMAAAAGGATVVTGVQRLDEPLLYNSLAVLDAQGQLTQTYDKHYLVPFGEYLPLGEFLARWGLRGLAAADGSGFAAGPGPQLIELEGIGAVLPLICYEAVFPQNLRTEQRPDLLLQITNDAWFGEFSGPYQHLAQARLRSIEQGLPMIRVANTGVSAVIDARGRIVDSLPLGVQGKLDTYLPATLPPTIYSKTGDLPIGVLLIAMLFTVLLRVRRNTI